ncbi:hypothetical protein ACJX0J_033083, partial [Zea mays]
MACHFFGKTIILVLPTSVILPYPLLWTIDQNFISRDLRFGIWFDCTGQEEACGLLEYYSCSHCLPHIFSKRHFYLLVRKVSSGSHSLLSFHFSSYSLIFISFDPFTFMGFL